MCVSGLCCACRFDWLGYARYLHSTKGCPAPVAPFSASNNVFAQSTPQTVVPAPGVLANDNLQDCTNLAVSVISQPSAGTVTAISSDGSFTYTPNDPNNLVSDAFIYQVTCITTGEMAFASVDLPGRACVCACAWVRQDCGVMCVNLLWPSWPVYSFVGRN